MTRKKYERSTLTDQVVEIATDCVTVWINASDGGLIGRFGPRGIDVHSSGETHCLDCRATPKDAPWDVFCASMVEHHGVSVPKSFKPAWCE